MSAVRVKCLWNIGAYRSGTVLDLSKEEAYRLEKLGAVSILRVAPGEELPEPDVAPEEAHEPEEAPETDPAPKRPGRPGRK